jgi:cell division protein FtsB
VLLTVVAATVFGFGIVPTRSYLDRKQQIADAQARLADLERANEDARAHVDRLRTDAEVERLAREQYGLVKQGEEPYKIVPPAQPPVQIPDVWPFDQLHRHLG